MRIVLLLMLMGAVGCGVLPDKSPPQLSQSRAEGLAFPAQAVGRADPLGAGRAEDAFGIWKVNPARSQDPYPQSLTVRFEAHAKGEVFTLDTIEADGRTTSTSTILYLDGKPRDFQDLGCSGTQSSRRVDSQTVEILRQCASGERTRLVRRLVVQSKELLLDIVEQHPDGRRFERRLVMEKE